MKIVLIYTSDFAADTALFIMAFLLIKLKKEK